MEEFFKRRYYLHKLSWLFVVTFETQSYGNERFSLTPILFELEWLSENKNACLLGINIASMSAVKVWNVDEGLEFYRSRVIVKTRGADSFEVW